MPIHHLNCGTMRPPLAPPMVAHVLLVERPEGLLLVDTGFGTDDLADPGRLGRPFRALVRPALDAAETARRQVERLGHRPEDVTDIAVTHLDLDHAGGLADFPNARVHVHATELAAARAPSLRERARYVAGQWAHGPRWAEHREGGDEWLGFPSATVLGDDVVMIPLPGHTRGHSGIAVRRDATDGGGWLLHAGDAFFSAGQLETPASCPRSLAAFQVVMAVDDRRRRANLERLRELATGHPDVTVVCAHDRSTYDALAG
ncbi:MAG: MBL fold metallo-hydrolase [Nocardioidaceae bacterium]|nr:MBL fold metallo-hydrolase [Nocardioidaceae bacterium]